MIHILKINTKKEDDLIWKRSSTISDDLNRDGDWTNHELKLSRKDDHTTSTGSIETKVIFDNGQYTLIHSSLDLLKWDTQKRSNATCTKAGIKAIYDESGQYILSKTSEAVPALGHDNGKWLPFNALKHQRICAHDSSHVEFENHVFTSVITTQPTCTSQGLKTYACRNCEYTYTQSLKAIGHDYGKWLPFNALKHQRICQHDASHVEFENHVFTSTVITKPTCTHQGVRTYTCKDCGSTYTKTLKATGHRFNKGKVIKKATTYATEKKVYTCLKCGKKKTVKLAKLKGIVVI